MLEEGGLEDRGQTSRREAGLGLATAKWKLRPSSHFSLSFRL